MPRTHASGSVFQGVPSLSDLLTSRPSGLTEQEAWAVLCQAVQALQDLFLSDGASGDSCIPLITPNTLLLSSRGRVRLCQENHPQEQKTPPYVKGYLAPEYKANRMCSDTETEKMWIYGLGETLKRATMTQTSPSRLSNDLCQVMAEMTRTQPSSRASLMHLLDVISEYCKRRQQSRPFSHIVMDLHQEAMAAIELALDTPWGPPAMPELRTLPRNRCETVSEVSHLPLIPRRWGGVLRTPERKKLTREASTSMEDLTSSLRMVPSNGNRPKSMCFPEDSAARIYPEFKQQQQSSEDLDLHDFPSSRLQRTCGVDSSKIPFHDRRARTRTRNAVQRAASRLYRAGKQSGFEPGPGQDQDQLIHQQLSPVNRETVGPEFVVRAALPRKEIVMPDVLTKFSARKIVTVIMLNGQKIDVICNPSTTTAGQLFEIIIQKEHIEENFLLGLSALIAGDFIFLPSDTRICKAIVTTPIQGASLTLFMRVRFFLPTLRGVRGIQTRHLLYLQLRRSILEHQLPCSFTQLVELDGLALQAEFGDFNQKEHGARDYFLLEHYVPETMTSTLADTTHLKNELIKAHQMKKGLDQEKAEDEFIALAQSLPQYGGHFYTATWVLKDGTSRDIWLYISSQGINIYKRSNSSSCAPSLYEMFEWRTIQTLCYSKHYLCILPHARKLHGSKLKKYKLKMDMKKSYFTFRLASLHHQFFLRLRTEYTSLQMLSQQFGIPLKDMKNETNSLCKLESLTNNHNLDSGAINADTEFKIEFKFESKSASKRGKNKMRRSKSVNDFSQLNSISQRKCDENDYFLDRKESSQNNKENEFPSSCVNGKVNGSLVLDSSCLSGLPITDLPGLPLNLNLNLNKGCVDKRRGVKMGTRAISNGQRVSRSMEAVNTLTNDELEQLSLQSVSLHCSTASIASPIVEHKGPSEVYVLDSTIKSCSQQFLPDFQETLSQSLMEKLNKFSFAEERNLCTVSVKKDLKGSLGMQITEGSDGRVYVQSVIPGGAAFKTGRINSGDQIISVNGHNLLSLKYETALQLLKNTGTTVDFILSQDSSSNQQETQQQEHPINRKTCIDLSNINESHLNSVSLDRTLSKIIIRDNSRESSVEKHVIENCHDISNTQKHIPYHKHIRYEIETAKLQQENKNSLLRSSFLQSMLNSDSLINQNGSKNYSKSCNNISYSLENDLHHHENQNKAVIVDMIRKDGVNSLDRTNNKITIANVNSNVNAYSNVNEINSLLEKDCDFEDKRPSSSGQIAMPRSLGLSRKWRGPVRYPVTPVKKGRDPNEGTTTSDEEQVFI